MTENNTATAAENRTTADRLIALAELCLFKTVEDAKAYQDKGGKFTPGIGATQSFNFRSDKLEEHKEEIRILAGDIVDAKLIAEDGEGLSWMELQYDRNGLEWGGPDHANVLICLCNAVGLCHFTHNWHAGMAGHPLLAAMGMSGMPFIRFSPSIRATIH